MKGFTLIEILVVVALIAILATAVVVSTVSFRSQIDLNTAAQNILNTLRIARAKTLASESASQYGVHFESGQYVLFKGTSYNPSASDNEFHSLPSGFEIANVSIGGGNDAIFQRLTGITSQSGSVDVRQISDPAKSKTIVIDPSGEVAFLGTVQSPAGTRVTDTRHVHIDYSRDVRSSVTLSLAFPGFSTTNISFQNYLNADKTEFNWEGTILVNGQNQVLKIHSHSLTSSAVQFSIHRPRPQNTEAVQINLDGENLINYAADGTTTQGSSLFVSNPQIQ